MASTSTILEGVGENFLTCPICIQYFTEPKLLPCLHRYCGSCLDSLITQQRNGDGELQCAVCRGAFTEPDKGFRTDYLMKSMIDFVKSEKLGCNAETHDCVGCRKKQLEAVAYCFKRKGFLCSTCFGGQSKKLDRSNDSTTVVSMKKISQELQRKGLRHERSFLCLIDEIASFAERERKRLQEKVSYLEQCSKNYLDEISATTLRKKRVDDLVRAVQEKLEKENKQEKEKWIEKTATLCRQLGKLDEVCSHIARVIKDTDQQKRYYKLTPQAREVMRENQTELMRKLMSLKEEGERHQIDLKARVKKVDIEFNKCMELLKSKHVDVSRNIMQNVSQRIRERCHKVSRLSSDILESQNDWMVVLKVRDTSAQIEHLAKEIKETFVKLEFDIFCSLSEFELLTDSDEEDCHQIQAISDILDEYDKDKLVGRGIGRVESYDTFWDLIFFIIIFIWRAIKSVIEHIT